MTQSVNLTIDKVMTTDLITVPLGTLLEEAEKLFHQHKIEKILMVDEKYLLKGLITYKEFPDQALIAGNIGTTEAAADLIRLGVDAVKVGVGPGSICTTRIVSGAGIPQITAIANVFKETEKEGIPLIADGSIKFSGDITKAIVAGASTVMIANMLAGPAESPGERIIFQGRSYKTYCGMGSMEAMHQGSRNRLYFTLIPAIATIPISFKGLMNWGLSPIY